MKRLFLILAILLQNIVALGHNNYNELWLTEYNVIRDRINSSQYVDAVSLTEQLYNYNSHLEFSKKNLNFIDQTATMLEDLCELCNNISKARIQEDANNYNDSINYKISKVIWRVSLMWLENSINADKKGIKFADSRTIGGKKFLEILFVHITILVYELEDYITAEEFCEHLLFYAKNKYGTQNKLYFNILELILYRCYACGQHNKKNPPKEYLQDYIELSYSTFSDNDFYDFIIERCTGAYMTKEHDIEYLKNQVGGDYSFEYTVVADEAYEQGNYALALEYYIKAYNFNLNCYKHTYHCEYRRHFREVTMSDLQEDSYTSRMHIKSIFNDIRRTANKFHRKTECLIDSLMKPLYNVDLELYYAVFMENLFNQSIFFDSMLNTERIACLENTLRNIDISLKYKYVEAQILRLIAVCYLDKNNSESIIKAEELMTKAKNVLSNANDSIPDNYLCICTRLAILRYGYSSTLGTDKIEEMETLLRELSICPKTEFYQEYFIANYLLSLAYYEQSNWDKSLMYALEAERVREKATKTFALEDIVIPEKYMAYENIQSWYSIDITEIMQDCMYNTNDLCGAIQYSIKDISNKLDDIIHDSEYGHYDFNKIESLINRTIYFANVFNSNEVYEKLFTVISVLKGFQYNSLKSIIASIYDSGNQTLINEIECNDSLLNDINIEYSNPQWYQRVRIIETSMKNRDYRGLLETTSNDIKNCIGKNDIYIEFVNSCDSIYCIVIEKGEKLEYLFLCLEHDLGIGQEDGLKSYDPIWLPIIKGRVQEVKNIYFSPCGKLCLLPIETLNSFSDINFHRVSSCKIITEKRDVKSLSSAMLCGNLFYYMHHNNKNRLLYNNNRGAIIDIPSLPETAREIHNIQKILSKSNIRSNIIEKENGNISNIKKILEEFPQIIHFATHGYYNVENDDSYYEGMRKTGMMLSYAGDCLLDDCSNEKGLLSAYDISLLNMNYVDLVVLSACETGLGTTNSDGVFGLQRGFKKAGANSILMSLWKVDDAATCKLMTEFYSNWIGKKMTKHDALEAAKKTVRETLGWEDPKYWAAFILLDGLD